jgi:hypothetical protein
VSGGDVWRVSESRGFVPLVVLGASLIQEAVADVEPDERGLASGIFETANHLFGGAVGVALLPAC